MDAVKKLPPSRRFLNHNLPKSTTRKIDKSTKPGTKPGTKSSCKKFQKSPTKKIPVRALNHETTCPEENPLIAPRKGLPCRCSTLYLSCLSKACFTLGLFNCNEILNFRLFVLSNNRTVTFSSSINPAPRLSHSWSNIQKTMKDNTQIISFSLCHGLQLAVPPKSDDAKFELCSRVGSKHVGSKMSFKPTGSKMLR